MSQTHLIQRQTVHLHLTNPADSWALQARVEQTLLDTRLLAQLDQMMSAMVGPDDWLEIDRLELSLGNLQPDTLETQLAERLLDELRRQLPEQKREVAGKTIAGTTSESGLIAWLFFLEYGYLPDYWPRPTSWAAFEMNVTDWFGNLTNGQRALVRQALRKPEIRQRLAEQHKNETFVAILQSLHPSVAQWSLLAAMVNVPVRVRVMWQVTLLLALTSDRNDVAEWMVNNIETNTDGSVYQRSWRAWLAYQIVHKKAPVVVENWLRDNMVVGRNIVPGSSGNQAPITNGLATSPTLPNHLAAVGTSYYVVNAGVVLLHPFLTTLFDACGWLRDGLFRNARSQAGAVRLLHFLATGDTHAPEYDLLLPKLLCGMAMDDPLPTHRLSRRVQAESITLLEAAISHWAALKDTSPDGLRSAFLQREGKLERRYDNWQLTVETKAQDALLTRLPYGWGLGRLHFSWMSEPLHVEWAY